jgi:hypothetical protein
VVVALGALGKPDLFVIVFGIAGALFGVYGIWRSRREWVGVAPLGPSYARAVRSIMPMVFRYPPELAVATGRSAWASPISTKRGPWRLRARSAR